MSSIGFHDAHESVYLPGSERAHMRMHCVDLAEAVLSNAFKPRYVSGTGYQRPPLMEFMPEDSYVHQHWRTFLDAVYDTPLLFGGGKSYKTVPNDVRHSFDTTIRTWFRVGSLAESKLLVPDAGDESIAMDCTDLALNTALAHGGDEVRLMARLYGQCEEFCWVAAEDRQWLADLAESGLGKHIFRQHAQEKRTWQILIEMLRRHDDSPVVCDYSVTESFPDLGLIVDEGILEQDTSGDGTDAFYDLPDDERWKLGLAALEAREKRLPTEGYSSNWTFRLRPEGFADFRYSWGLSAFDISHLLWLKWIEPGGWREQENATIAS